MSEQTIPPEEWGEGMDPRSLIRAETGRVDARQLNSLGEYANGITPHVCAMLRCQMLDGTSASAMADELGTSRREVTTHAKGNCDCDVDAPALTFEGHIRSGEWVRR